MSNSEEDEIGIWQRQITDRIHIIEVYQGETIEVVSAHVYYDGFIWIPRNNDVEFVVIVDIHVPDSAPWIIRVEVEV